MGLNVNNLIIEFRNEYNFLSNFFEYPIIYKDKEYKTVEHLYQSFKTTDMKERERIRLLPYPGMAKKQGRLLKVREDWGNIKIAVMKLCIDLKFGDLNMAILLLETKNKKLIEGNLWHDTFWGCCMCKRCCGVGENNLGKLLMNKRDSFKTKRTVSGIAKERVLIKRELRKSNIIFDNDLSTKKLNKLFNHLIESL